MDTLIKVVVDKSHITTIGEKLYGESMELIRELVSNAYDADAVNVHVTLETDTISVKDDGTGMNHEGLKEYFNIGSQNKLRITSTPRFGRQKIGQFGIGKFAVLAACNRFRIITSKDGVTAEVVFDKTEWKNSAAWSVPIREIIGGNERGIGTTVILEELNKTFTAGEIERFVRERMPLSAPHFCIFVNGHKIEPALIAGRRFALAAKTLFGMIKGEIIAPNFRQKIPGENSGVEVTVNGMVIKKEMFGMEIQPAFAVHKLKGRIAADFLPITSDRGRFIVDSAQYRIFLETMQKEIRKIVHSLNESVELKEKQKADETLKQTMSRLSRAIRKNPAFSPKIMSATGEIDEGADHPNSLTPQSSRKEWEDIEAFRLELLGEGNDVPKDPLPFTGIPSHLHPEEKIKKVKVKNLAGKTLTARRIKIGGLGIVCNIDRFGKQERPVFVESGIIYINQDHSLYQKQARLGKENLEFYLAYLLSQQISLLVAATDSYRAFEIQGKLLADAF